MARPIVSARPTRPTLYQVAGGRGCNQVELLVPTTGYAGSQPATAPRTRKTKRTPNLTAPRRQPTGHEYQHISQINPPVDVVL